MNQNELPSFPSSVVIDASTICQLKCAKCNFQRGNYEHLGRGFLKFENFKRFIDENSNIKRIELANYGEALLNPEMIQILEHAHSKNVSITMGHGVNFNTCQDELLEALVRFQVKSMTISLDGVTQDMYAKYRINGDYEQVINNIKKLNEFKRQHSSDYPRLRWQFIIMQHNEDGVIDAKKKAKELGMSIGFKLTWSKGYEPTPSKIEMLKRETGLESLTRKEANADKKTHFSNRLCKRLWAQPVINWDGRLLGCCCNPRMDFGVNVFESSLEYALNVESYKYAKEMLLGCITPSEIPEHLHNKIPCIKCKMYRLMNEIGMSLRET